MIKAEGKYGGRKLVVVVDKGKMTFNGVEDKVYGQLLRHELKERYPMGGTYYPEMDSKLNLVNVLGNHFFDEPVDVAVKDEDIGIIPEEKEGVVY